MVEVGAPQGGPKRNTQVQQPMGWHGGKASPERLETDFILGLLGMASIDSSAPETTSDSSPTLSRRPLRGGWAPTSWGRGQDSDSISSSSSDSLGSSSSSGSRRASASGGARAKTVEVGRSVGRNTHLAHPPSVAPLLSPNGLTYPSPT